MRTVLSLAVIFVAFFAVNAIYTKGHDGRPHCNTPEEMNSIFWRNNNDPTTYWVCGQENTPAAATDCEAGTGFLASEKRCVDWAFWQWEDPVNPPSMSY